MTLLRKIYYRLYIYWLALHWIRSFNLGDKVIYQDEIWTLYQGVSKPVWKLSRNKNIELYNKLYQQLTIFGSGHPLEDDEIVEQINKLIIKVVAHEDDFRKVRSFRNYFNSYKSGVRFYMTSWYGIWVRKGIKNSSACTADIWKDKPPKCCSNRTKKNKDML